jgi:hypothetical protein
LHRLGPGPIGQAGEPPQQIYWHELSYESSAKLYLHCTALSYPDPPVPCMQSHTACMHGDCSLSGTPAGAAVHDSRAVLQVLLLAWKMRAKRMGYFSREEFQTGASAASSRLA